MLDPFTIIAISTVIIMLILPVCCCGICCLRFCRRCLVGKVTRAAKEAKDTVQEATQQAKDTALEAFHQSQDAAQEAGKQAKDMALAAAQAMDKARQECQQQLTNFMQWCAMWLLLAQLGEVAFGFTSGIFAFIVTVRPQVDLNHTILVDNGDDNQRVDTYLLLCSIGLDLSLWMMLGLFVLLTRLVLILISLSFCLLASALLISGISKKIVIVGVSLAGVGIFGLEFMFLVPFFLRSVEIFFDVVSDSPSMGTGIPIHDVLSTGRKWNAVAPADQARSRELWEIALFKLIYWHALQPVGYFVIFFVFSWSDLGWFHQLLGSIVALRELAYLAAAVTCFCVEDSRLILLIDLKESCERLQNQQVLGLNKQLFRMLYISSPELLCYYPLLERWLSENTNYFDVVVAFTSVPLLMKLGFSVTLIGVFIMLVLACKGGLKKFCGIERTFWDTATLELKSEKTNAHRGYLRSVASPDGKTIVSGSGDRTIKVWDSATLEIKSKKTNAHSSYVNSVAFSPDGKTI
ncbi:MAG: hypothetical protein SGPRY_014559, partial [Prymnesium sp.]